MVVLHKSQGDKGRAITIKVPMVPLGLVHSTRAVIPMDDQVVGVAGMAVPAVPTRHLDLVGHDTLPQPFKVTKALSDSTNLATEVNRSLTPVVTASRIPVA